ncbi:MAG TPA: DEAD/DEAH box helicase [Kofleriaceae bacterium]|nr:DEAD/DEAH box helicase [Kofleriaceae bacterium]
MSFSELGLSEPLQRAVRELNYQSPTPIQAQAIPSILRGRDLLGCAQTGTGKTAAFALPILQGLAASGRLRAPRALIVSPTRELATQIADDVRAYGRHLRLSATVVFGGVSQVPQVAALARGVDILVATPGRLLDLLQQGAVNLASVTVLVLDEADRMLDMGFLPDVRRIVAALPARRQTLLFSATMPPEIAGLAARLLDDPVRVSVAPPATTAEKVRQKVYMVARDDKPALLLELLSDPALARVLVFTRTKHGADRLCRRLERGAIAAAAIHGNKSQNARQRALEDFRRGAARVLVASDIAARGLDIDDITHVVNYDIPNEPETYVHRIGRTARAGATGEALSFCGQEERGFLRAIESLVRTPIQVDREHSFARASSASSAPSATAPASRGGRPGGGGRPVKNGADRGASGSGPAGRNGPGRSGRAGGPPREQRTYGRRGNSSAAAQEKHRRIEKWLRARSSD